MNGKITQSLVAGIGATIAMTLVIFMAPMIGMPKMNPPGMLSAMLGVPIAVGWVMHFVMGIVFGAAYVFVFRPKVKVANNLIKGVIFGIVIFIFAQVGIGAMGAIFNEAPTPEGPMVLIAIGGIVGHVVFGVAAAMLAKSSND